MKIKEKELSLGKLQAVPFYFLGLKTIVILDLRYREKCSKVKSLKNL